MAYTTIKKPSDYFNTKLYTGNGTDDTGITGVGFQPDFVWIKSRSDGSWHNLFDVIRGATTRLNSNSTNADNTASTTLQSFDTDGFTVGTGGDVNGNSINYASWNWLGANGTASNTDGSITSTVSANTTSGFSIVSYTGNGSAGATIGHGLGSTPSVIFVKGRSNTENWRVYHKGTDASAPQDYDLKLNLTNARDNDNTVWNDTAPTSSVFTLGSSTSVNANGATMIAYCFAEKKGFSKFGSYTGNGNADGTFVYTGFKPAFIMCKVTTTTNQWGMFDNKREGYNVANDILTANTSGVEEAGSYFDILSNGFKARSTSAVTNSSGATYIYMAFAEEPLVGDNPATAR